MKQALRADNDCLKAWSCNVYVQYTVDRDLCIDAVFYLLRLLGDLGILYQHWCDGPQSDTCIILTC